MLVQREIAGKLLGLGPARQGVRTVSGPEGSSTKDFTLGAAGVPGPSNLLAIPVFVSKDALRLWTLPPRARRA